MYTIAPVTTIIGHCISIQEDRFERKYAGMQKGRWEDRCICAYVRERVYLWMERDGMGWMDGWMDGWVDGWMDGWICIYAFMYTTHFIKSKT